MTQQHDKGAGQGTGDRLREVADAASDKLKELGASAQEMVENVTAQARRQQSNSSRLSRSLSGAADEDARRRGRDRIPAWRALEKVMAEPLVVTIIHKLGEGIGELPGPWGQAGGLVGRSGRLQRKGARAGG
jgi:hypothetical protein